MKNLLFITLSILSISSFATCPTTPVDGINNLVEESPQGSGNFIPLCDIDDPTERARIIDTNIIAGEDIRSSSLNLKFSALNKALAILEREESILSNYKFVYANTDFNLNDYFFDNHPDNISTTKINDTLIDRDSRIPKTALKEDYVIVSRTETTIKGLFIIDSGRCTLHFSDSFGVSIQPTAEGSSVLDMTTETCQQIADKLNFVNTDPGNYFGTLGTWYY